MEQGANASAATGKGIEGEEVIWEASYSMKNFLGRIVFRVLLTVAWIALAVETWAGSQQKLAPITIALGIALVVFWLMLLYRMVQARYGHYYRLTNRRPLHLDGPDASSPRPAGIAPRQGRLYATVAHRALDVARLGHRGFEREGDARPYITGVSDPKEVMDLIWDAAPDRTRRPEHKHPEPLIGFDARIPCSRSLPRQRTAPGRTSRTARGVRGFLNLGFEKETMLSGEGCGAAARLRRF